MSNSGNQIASPSLLYSKRRSQITSSYSKFQVVAAFKAKENTQKRKFRFVRHDPFGKKRFVGEYPESRFVTAPLPADISKALDETCEKLTSRSQDIIKLIGMLVNKYKGQQLLIEQIEDVVHTLSIKSIMQTLVCSGLLHIVQRAVR
ncbi:hypothetical protein DSO57_1005621 [Entomophthora muscae]|uniref:Uncharacterized protein n=1 Tax=Entomophthora muscae TaxID=34485 RepID=A0ACC2RMU5_9FUNG|nr:hypothetical protein DSO57_1005621 [Entomophthora muscae]